MSKKQQLGALQQKWVEALESGEFKQCTGRLKKYKYLPDHIESKYCCLGVADEVCDLGEYAGETTLRHVYTGLGLYDPEGGFKGNSTIKVIDKGNEYSSLVLMNDKGKLSFKTIAKMIRKYPELVFAKEV